MKTAPNNMHSSLQDFIEHRKTGLSLNHVVGCPLNCSYCVRHLFDNYDVKNPTQIVPNYVAVEALLSHKNFEINITPIQIFNRATDPFLPETKGHLFQTLELLDAAGIRNHVIIISRYKVLESDLDRMNHFKNIKVSLFFTFSGILDKRIEPVSSDIAKESYTLACSLRKNFKVFLYWRPIIEGVNDSDMISSEVARLGELGDGVVISGLFFKGRIAEYFERNKIVIPYDSGARRKILPRSTEEKVLNSLSNVPVYRKTSCAVSAAWGEGDYNGHYGIREICDICSDRQLAICAQNHSMPTRDAIEAIIAKFQVGARLVSISEEYATVCNSTEQERYLLQHHFRFQFHDEKYPHKFGRHGKAEIGWS